MTIRYRAAAGKAHVALRAAAAVARQRSLLTSDVSLKVKVFTVGFHSCVTRFRDLEYAATIARWTVVAQHEPKWDLPFLTERLIRSPLHRPFDGAGRAVPLRACATAPARRSVFSRRTRLDVQESAIMRFLGSLASHALGDLDTQGRDRGGSLHSRRVRRAAGAICARSRRAGE